MLLKNWWYIFTDHIQYVQGSTSRQSALTAEVLPPLADDDIDPFEGVVQLEKNSDGEKNPDAVFTPMPHELENPHDADNG